MPIKLNENPCLVCGKPTKRYKYCEPCAKEIKLDRVRYSNRHRNDVIFKKDPISYNESFCWDNANDPRCG